MMDQKNLLLAIVLSVAILIGFQYFFETIRPKPAPTPPGQTQTGQTQTGQTQTAPAQAPAKPGSATTAAVPTDAPGVGHETREEAIAEKPRVRINTPRLHGSIALTGGRLDDLTLANYHETVDPKSPEVVLLWPKGTQGTLFRRFRLGCRQSRREGQGARPGHGVVRRRTSR